MTIDHAARVLVQEVCGTCSLRHKCDASDRCPINVVHGEAFRALRMQVEYGGQRCPQCNGTGKVRGKVPVPPQPPPTTCQCPTCAGKGKVP